jgi:hypothetical protein
MQYQAFGNLPHIVIYHTLLDGEFPSSICPNPWILDDHLNFNIASPDRYGGGGLLHLRPKAQFVFQDKFCDENHTLPLQLGMV